MVTVSRPYHPSMVKWKSQILAIVLKTLLVVHYNIKVFDPIMKLTIMQNKKKVSNVTEWALHHMVSRNSNPEFQFSGRIRVNCKNLRSITPYLDDRVWIILKTPPRQSRNLLELNSVPRELIYQDQANRRPSTRNSYKGMIAAYLIPFLS